MIAAYLGKGDAFDQAVGRSHSTLLDGWALQQAIDETSLKIDRLVLAGRLESAIRMVETTVGELGDFDEAKQLRKKIKKEMASIQSTGP